MPSVFAVGSGEEWGEALRVRVSKIRPPNFRNDLLCVRLCVSYFGPNGMVRRLVGLRGSLVTYRLKGFDFYDLLNRLCHRSGHSVSAGMHRKRSNVCLFKPC